MNGPGREQLAREVRDLADQINKAAARAREISRLLKGSHEPIREAARLGTLAARITDYTAAIRLGVVRVRLPADTDALPLFDQVDRAKEEHEEQHDRHDQGDADRRPVVDDTPPSHPLRRALDGRKAREPRRRDDPKDTGAAAPITRRGPKHDPTPSRAATTPRAG